MPSLSFFVDEHDLCLLLDRLNADPEIAFIVPDDPVGPESEKPDQTPRHSAVFHVHRVRDGSWNWKWDAPIGSGGKRFESWIP